MNLNLETKEFLRGYHAAMLEVAKECLEKTKDAEKAHKNLSPTTFFGKPKLEHYVELGKGRAFTTIGDYVFKRGLEAFSERVKK